MKVILALLATVLPALSQKTAVRLDPGGTQINFTLSDFLHTVHGTFKLTKGDFWFDLSSGEAGGGLIVSSGSGDSGSHARDSRMDKNILQTDVYPLITFTPDRVIGRINGAGHSEFRLHGIFGIHGATHELSMNVKSEIRGARLTARADFDVPYVRWGIKNPSTLMLRVNQTVQIEIQTDGQIAAGSQN